MSQFSGKRFKGALRDRRAEKKREAEARNASPRHSCNRGLGHAHNEAGAARCGQ